MTNNHCVGSQSELGNAKFVIREIGMQKQSYSCNRLLLTDKRLDFSLLECQGNPGLEHGYLKLGTRVPRTSEKIYVTQVNCNYQDNPGCSPERFTSYGLITKSKSTIVDHSADTLAGSSGSPIFSTATNELVALHNAGLSGNGKRRATNFGIPMLKIRQFIEGRLPRFKLTSSDYSPKLGQTRSELCR